MANLKKLYCLGRRKETLKNSIFHGPEKTSVSHTLGDMFSKKRETMWGLLIQRTICIYHYRKAPYLCVWCRHAIYIRGLQIREGGNGENWEGPQFDPVVRPVEPESLSSLGAREHLPIEARKKACFMLWF